ncbi:CsgG/HfaB family protein [Undibacterium sp. Ji22W]|uniref:CsgG/HfaB family protein n=1 Tax=Undibacterium sp. Ji22W TaxID=3413038 RepID=UPI003BF13256
MSHRFSVVIGSSLISSLLVMSSVQAQSIQKGAIEKCSKNLGTLAVVEPQSHMLASLSNYKLGSPSTMLRMIVEESGCFTVVERGVALQNIRQERELAAGGQLQQGSNVGGGQLQAADFVMTPSVQFASDTGGVGGAVGGLLGRFGGALGALGGLAGGVKFKEAETTLLLADVRSGIQVASAEGQASKMDFSLGGWGWGGFGWASAGGYSKTPEGKLIAASLLDNYNKIVQTVRNKDQLIQATSQASKNNAANSIQATPPSQVAAQQYTQTAAPSVGSPAVTKSSASPGLTGMYSVKFAGDDEGTVNVMINKNGSVTGMGKSTKYNFNFNVAGTVSPDGEMSLASSGKAGSAKFMGSVDLQTGAVVGMWQWEGNHAGQGTFNGQKL